MAKVYLTRIVFDFSPFNVVFKSDDNGKQNLDEKIK